MRRPALFASIALTLAACGGGSSPTDAALRTAIEARLAEGASTARGNLDTAVTCAADALKPLSDADKRRLIDAKLADTAMAAMAADATSGPAFARFTLCVLTYFTGQDMQIPAVPQ